MSIEDQQDAEVCSRCNVEIMYESPDNFSPVCYDDDEVHCEECCTCGDDEDDETR